MPQQLTGRDIDARKNRLARAHRALPDRELLGGLVHHEQAEIDDQADFFGDRDEFHRRHPPELGMIPARQRLEAGDRAVFQPHDRLVQDGDFLALDGAAQFAFQGQPVALARAHRRLVDVDAVAADPLGVIHRQLGVLDDLVGQLGLRIGQRQADRGGEEDLAVVEGDRRADGLADGLGEGGDARRILFRHQDQAELVAGEPRQRVLRLQDAGQPPRQRQQDGIADRDADGIVDLLEAVEIDHHQGGAQVRHGLGEIGDRAEAVDEQFAVRQAGEVVVHGVVQHALLGVLGLGDVGQRADHAGDLAVGADHRARLQREPHEVAVGGAQAEILHQPAAALVEHAVERGAETVLVERMQHFQPFRGRAFQRAALEAEQGLGLGAGEHLVGGDVPVPDQVAGAGQRQRAALDVGDHAGGGAAAGEGVLHHGKSDQHHDQHQAAEQRRADDVVGDGARHRHAGGDHPDHQQEPGRDQQHRAVETVGREIDDEGKTRERDQNQRHPRDAGSHRGIEQRQRHQRAEEGEPADGDVRIAHMPAAEIEIGEQEHQ